MKTAILLLIPALLFLASCGNKGKALLFMDEVDLQALPVKYQFRLVNSMILKDIDKILADSTDTAFTAKIEHEYEILKKETQLGLLGLEKISEFDHELKYKSLCQKYLSEMDKIFDVELKELIATLKTQKGAKLKESAGKQIIGIMDKVEIASTKAQMISKKYRNKYHIKPDDSQNPKFAKIKTDYENKMMQYKN